MRNPLAFWAAVAAFVLAAMTAVWVAKDDDREGAILVIAGVAWWLAGLTLIVIGLVVFARRTRRPDDS